MIALRLCWRIYVLWCICLDTNSQLASAESNDRTFELENEVRYGCGVIATHEAHSLTECGLMCVNAESCSDFNFGSGQCELFSATASGRFNAPGWTHGCYPAGKYQTRQQTKRHSCPKQIQENMLYRWQIVVLVNEIYSG